MMSPDLGPKGCWDAAIFFSIFGVIAFLVLLVKGIIWLINHIRFE